MNNGISFQVADDLSSVSILEIGHAPGPFLTESELTAAIKALVKEDLFEFDKYLCALAALYAARDARNSQNDARNSQNDARSQP